MKTKQIAASAITKAFLFFTLAACAYAAVLYVTIAASAQLGATRAAYQAESAREDARHLLKSKLAELAQEQTTLSGYFFSKENLNGILNAIEAYGAALGVNVSTERLAQVEGKSGVLSFILSAEGTQAALLSYVEELERAPYLLSVESVELIRSQEARGGWVLRVILSAIGYEE